MKEDTNTQATRIMLDQIEAAMNKINVVKELFNGIDKLAQSGKLDSKLAPKITYNCRSLVGQTVNRLEDYIDQLQRELGTP